MSGRDCLFAGLSELGIKIPQPQEPARSRSNRRHISSDKRRSRSKSEFIDGRRERSNSEGNNSLLKFENVFPDLVVWGDVGDRPKEQPATRRAFRSSESDARRHSRKRIAGVNVFDSSLLDRQFDRDYREVDDDDRERYRGGCLYERPFLFYRHALKVVGKYENDYWLGSAKKRRNSSLGEWPVSYHGTGRTNAMSIADQGYLLSKGKRFRFGYGIYTTPSVATALTYATKYEYNHKWYALIFQNRICPDSMIEVDSEETGLGEYWISPNQSDVRPYAICIKEIFDE